MSNPLYERALDGLVQEMADFVAERLPESFRGIVLSLDDEEGAEFFQVFVSLISPTLWDNFVQRHDLIEELKDLRVPEYV